MEIKFLGNMETMFTVHSNRRYLVVGMSECKSMALLQTPSSKKRILVQSVSCLPNPAITKATTRHVKQRTMRKSATQQAVSKRGDREIHTIYKGRLYWVTARTEVMEGQSEKWPVGTTLYHVQFIDRSKTFRIPATLCSPLSDEPILHKYTMYGTLKKRYQDTSLPDPLPAEEIERRFKAIPLLKERRYATEQQLLPGEPSLTESESESAG